MNSYNIFLESFELHVCYFTLVYSSLCYFVLVLETQYLMDKIPANRSPQWQGGGVYLAWGPL